MFKLCMVGHWFTWMESSEHCNRNDHLLKARGEEVCGVYLAHRPLALLPPGLTLSPLDPCPLPLTLSAAPLFHFPPNSSIWQIEPARKRSIIVPHLILLCPLFPPLLTLSLLPLLSLLQDIPSFPLCIFTVLMVSCFSLHGHFVFLPLPPPHNLIFFCLLSWCTVHYCLCLNFFLFISSYPLCKLVFVL